MLGAPKSMIEGHVDNNGRRSGGAMTVGRASRRKCLRDCDSGRF
jgi:hypothetical protein